MPTRKNANSVIILNLYIVLVTAVAQVQFSQMQEVYIGMHDIVKWKLIVCLSQSKIHSSVHVHNLGRLSSVHFPFQVL